MRQPVLSAPLSSENRYLRSIDSRLAIDSIQLPRWLRQRDGREPRGPNGRFIVATARRLNDVLLTCDEETLEYASQGHLRAYDAWP